MAAPPQRRSLLRNRDFVRLWCAETISQFGTQVTLLALPLAAIVILEATPFQVGALTAVEVAPFLLVGLPAGVWVDRLRRRPILIAGDVGRAVVLASVPVAHALDVLTMGQLYVVAFTAGVLTVFFDVAYQSYLPSLVPRDRIVEGNARLELSRSAAHLAGPGVAGVLIGAIDAAPAVAVDAASFAASALFLVAIRAPEPAVPAPEARTRMRTEIATGVRYVLGHRLLRPIAMCTGTSNLFSSILTAVYVLYAVRELDLSPGRIGFVFMLGNVGVVVGALVAGRIATWFGTGPAIVASAATFSLGGLLFLPASGAAEPEPWLVAGWFLFGFGGTVYNINQVGLRQAITEHGMLGRMNATMRFLVWGTMPIGALGGGTIADAVGLRTAFVTAVVGGTASFLPVLLSPVRSLRTIPEDP